MRKQYLRLGAVLAALGVILGAFAAHGLEKYVAPAQIETFQTGVRYHFYHSFGIMLVGVLMYMRRTPLMRWVVYSFAGGILLFSGSLYLLSLRQAFDLPIGWLGPITPVGGLLFITGWILLAVTTFQDNERYRRKEE